MQTKPNIPTAQRFYTIMSVAGFVKRKKHHFAEQVGSMEGKRDRIQQGQLLVRTSMFQQTYNQSGGCQDKKDSINCYRFHNVKSFRLWVEVRWVKDNKHRGEGNTKKVRFFVTFSLQPVPASRSFEEWREIRNLRLQTVHYIP